MPDKSRYVYLYLPSQDDKARWEKLAKEAVLPLSKFVIEVVESALAENTEFKTRSELVKGIGRLRTENKELKDDLRKRRSSWRRVRANLEGIEAKHLLKKIIRAYVGIIKT